MDAGLQANGALAYHYLMVSRTKGTGARWLPEGRRSFAVLVCLTTALSSQAHAQDDRSSLFQTAETALAVAEEADAQVLAPAAFESGMNAYAAAENDFARGRNISRVQSRLADAEAAFNQAAETAEAAANTFATLLQARRETLDAGADIFAVELWDDAEAAFRAVSRRLESSPSASVNDRIPTVESQYRNAELTAIKAQNLSQTRALLAQAALDGVPQLAPRTHARAEALLAEAEAALDENRYEVEPARALAEQAAYEARRAIFMTRRVRELVDRERTVEDLILEYEQGFTRLANAAGRDARLDTGPDPVIEDVVAEIETLRQQGRQLQVDIEASRIRIAALEDEIRELDARLGGISRERVELVRQLEAEERAREQFLRVENMFSVDQAQVAREGDSVIITLTGLTFASGSSLIDDAHAPLLEAVREAVDIFPLSRVVVEGHTDSLGGSNTNMSLSRDRAEAVGAWLTDRLGVAGERISSLGFGETRPVANNETAQGRARNRRIEVRITPQPRD